MCFEKKRACAGKFLSLIVVMLVLTIASANVSPLLQVAALSEAHFIVPVFEVKYIR